MGDSFAMGPSGYGYEIIDKCNDIESFAQNTIGSIVASGNVLSNVNVIDDWDAKNGKYSPNIDAMLDVDESNAIKSILYYYGDAYVGGNGQIFWHGDTPIITGKEAL